MRRRPASALLPLFVALLQTFVAGCSPQESPQPIEPLFRGIADFPSMDTSARESFVHRNHSALDAMCRFVGLGEPTDSLIARWAMSAPVKAFTPPTDSVFADLAPLEGAIGHVLATLAKENIDIPARRYDAVVWGSPKSIVLTDSCVLIALNHFLGADFPGYAGWPAYVRELKTPRRVPYSVCEALVASALPFDAGESPTVLAQMAYEGALAATMLACVDGATPASALGYDKEQYEWLEAHKKEIWQSLAAGNMLHTTDSTVADRLLNPAPATSLLGPDCPGRAGRYIGFLIVRHCMRHLGISLEQALSPAFYANPSVLIDSQFKIGN